MQAQTNIAASAKSFQGLQCHQCFDRSSLVFGLEEAVCVRLSLMTEQHVLQRQQTDLPGIADATGSGYWHCLLDVELLA